MADPYATEVHRWWHLSRPSPELVRAVESGWLGPAGRTLDLGCGLGSEVGFLTERGFIGVGIDLSLPALHRARLDHPAARILGADVRRLPFGTATFDVLIDRGCFHYLEQSDRPIYAEEARRVLRPGGRLFLRACLRTAGVRNDIDEVSLRAAFTGWRWLRSQERDLPSDTRAMPSLVALLERIG